MKNLPRSNAFTLIELLVVMSIVSLMIAVLLPALGKARESARQIECGSNLKGLTVAMISYAEVFNRFPVDFNAQTGNTQNVQHWKASLAKFMGWNFTASGSPYFQPSTVTTSDRRLFFCPNTSDEDYNSRLTTSVSFNNNLMRFYGMNSFGNFGGISTPGDAREKNPLTFARTLVLMLDGLVISTGGDVASATSCNPSTSSTPLTDLIRHAGTWGVPPDATGKGPATVNGGAINVAMTDGRVIVGHPGLFPLRGGINFAAGVDDRYWDMRQP